MARSNLFPNGFNGVNLEKLIFQLLLKPVIIHTRYRQLL